MNYEKAITSIGLGQDTMVTSAGRPVSEQVAGGGYSPRASFGRPTTSDAHAILAADQRHRSLQADQILMLKMVMPSFSAQIKQLSEGLFHWFKHQGFWPKDWEPYFQGVVGDSSEQTNLKKMEKLGLIVTEVAECMEAVRKGDSTNEADELADVLIRVLDYAGGFNLPLAQAFEEKMLKNYARPLKHGKGF